MRVDSSRWIFLATVFSSLFIAACSRAPEPDPVSQDTTTDGALEPVIREVGTAVVHRVVVSFARPVARADQVGEVLGDSSRVRIQPETEGEWRIQTADSIAFIPSTPLPPGEGYRVDLDALATPLGLVAAPEGGWSYEFRTKAFALARFSPVELDYANRRMEVAAAFTGTIDRRDLRRHGKLSLEVNGRSVEVPVTWSLSERPNVATALVQHPGIQPGNRMTLTLESGLATTQGQRPRAAASTLSFDLHGSPPMQIVGAYANEGTNGFYLQVVCNDSAVNGKRYYYDEIASEYHGQISTRCQLNEDEVAEKIHIEPEVDVDVASSGGGFRILGDFRRGVYTVRIDAGARTSDDGYLLRDFERHFTIPARAAKVQFVSSGRYLPRNAWRSLPIRHMNVDQVTLSVRHVPPENLVFWMGEDANEDADERTSNVIATRELKVPLVADTWQTSYVDTESLVSRGSKGLLELNLEVLRDDQAAPVVRDSARIILTDMQLVAKRSGVSSTHPWGRQIRVWALDSSTIRPIQEVDVRLVRKSGFTVGECITGWDGGCTVDVPASDLDPAPPFALVASKEDELTYLKFSELKTEIQQARVSGLPFGADAKYRASIYFDRGVYRPGETAHVSAILRTADDLAPEAGMPTELMLIDPQGRTIREDSLPVNSAGMILADHRFPDFATTGRYEVRMTVAERVIGTGTLQVEEFVPERMRVEVDSEVAALRLGEDSPLDVAARYLFGGVPGNHRVEMSCELTPGGFSPAGNANFHFGVWADEGAPQRSLSLGSVSSALDAEGMAQLRCPGEGRAGGFRGPAQLVARAAVFEAGSGRTSVGEHRIAVHPENFYIGLSSSAERIRAGDEVRVEGVVVDWSGSAVRDVQSIEVELMNLEVEYGYFFDEARGQEIYRRTRRPALAERRLVSVADGRFDLSWVPQETASGYLIRARAQNARTDLELSGRGWYYYAPEDQTPRPDKPTWIAVDVPDSANVGDNVSVSFRSPFRGRVLLTAETDRVVASEWKTVDAGEVQWSFRLRDFVPNVYVSAFMIKDPHADTAEAFLPERAFGVESVRIVPEKFAHDLRIEVPAEIRSNATLEVGIDLGRLAEPTFVTVAAVDEGILSLTDFESPDPLKDIFSRRALGVETFETIGWTLMMPPESPSSTTGGDTGGGPGRVQPIEPVALWSGLVEVPRTGKTTVSFDLPQYRGALRVMAVSAGASKMGHASSEVIVRDPLLLQTTLPRFLLKGDSLQVPVFLTNLSGATQDVRVEMLVESFDAGGAITAADSPPVRIEGVSERSMTLANEENGVAVFDLRTLASSGAARLRVRAHAGSLSSDEELVVPVLPNGPRRRTIQTIPLEVGDTDLTQHLNGWLPMSERSNIWVTSSPYGDAFNHLQYLLRYPYGCIEQTTSTLRPLLFTRDLLSEVDPEFVRTHDVDDMVLSGVERLFSMQTPAGGFAYWPGSSEPTYWGTAYATHTLLDAQKLQYPISAGRLDEALDWMENVVANYYPNRSRPLDAARGAEPYMHYVLALAERPQKARAARLLQALDPARSRVERERIFMLKAALFLAGDRSYEADLRRVDLTPVESTRRNDWTFYSDQRMRGFMLATYLDLFGRDGAKPLADLVAESLRGRRSRYYTTQELVWSVTGLGKFVEPGAGSFQASLIANGQAIPSQGADTGKPDASIWDVVRASEYEGLALRVREKEDGNLFALVQSEGVRAGDRYEVGGEGLSVARRFVDSAGVPVDLRSLTLGDMVYVETTIANTSSQRIANVALVDRIPAGWEIENPRLGRSDSQSLEFVDTEALWAVDYLNLRDDRVELFGHLDKGEVRQVIYAVRAVTSGRFQLPPVEAEAMYNPSQWARQSGGLVTIRGPWF